MRSHGIPFRIACPLLRWPALRRVALSLLLLNSTAPALAAESPSFAYVTNKYSNNVSMFERDLTTGALRPLGAGSVPTGKEPLSVTPHPSSRFVYVVDEDPNQNHVSTYAVASSGELILQGQVEVGPTTGAFGVNPSGRFAYMTTSYVQGQNCTLCNVALSDHSLVRLAIDPSDGTLTVAEAVDAGGRLPYGLAIHRSGLVVYVVNQGSNNVAMFTSDPDTGALRLVRTAPTGRGPSVVLVHHSGNYVYVANRDDNTISMFTWLLQPLVPATVVSGTTAAALAITPNGEFLYETDWQYGTVTMFSINQLTGVLTPLNPSSVPAGGFPYGFESAEVDATGRFVYVANLFDNTSYQSGEVALFRIDLTETPGLLQPLGTFRAGNRPTSVTTTNPLDYQAQQDMMQRAAQDSRFEQPPRPLYATFGKNRLQGKIVNWDSAWEIRSMDFSLADGGRIVTIYHATWHADSSVRFTNYSDPDNNEACTEWLPVPETATGSPATVPQPAPSCPTATPTQPQDPPAAAAPPQPQDPPAQTPSSGGGSGGGGGCSMVLAHAGAPVPWLAAFGNMGLPCLTLALMQVLRRRRGSAKGSAQ